MITIIIPVAAIPTNPDTWVLEETLRSIRYHFPDNKIILTYDYPSEQYLHLLDNYNEFKKRIKNQFDNGNWGNIVQITFGEHMHQTGAFIEAMNLIDTEHILYVEQDTPLIEKEMPWDKFCELIDKGIADSIQLAHTTKIPDEHWHMMLDKEPRIIEGIPLIRTYQWSQRPHISSMSFYKMLFKEYVNGERGRYIEHIIYGQVVGEYLRNGWGKFKIYNYHPDDPNIQRSTHLDGRKRLDRYSSF